MSILKEMQEKLPADAKISEVKFEGSEIVMYTKNRDFFVNSEPSVKELVRELKKRVEIRPDISICSDPEKTKKTIQEIVPEGAGIVEIYFEPELGKVIIEAQKPGLIIGKGGETFKRIKNETLWLPKIERAPAIKSDVVRAVRNLLHSELDYRKKFLNMIGQKINQKPESGYDRNKEWVRLSTLGGFRQVGRSSMLLQTSLSSILIDCGIDVASDQVPYLNAPEFSLDKLDAIVLSHAHLDHCLTPDAMVQLSDGNIRPISDVVTGQPVEALDFKYSMDIESIPAIQRGSIEAPNLVYEVRTKTKRIKATGNHPLFVLGSDGSFSIKHVEQLKPGDFVATPRIVDIEGELQQLPKMANIDELNEDVAQVLGYIVGDGCKREPGTVVITDKNMDNLKFYLEKIEKLGIAGKLTSDKRNRLTVYSAQFKRWLDSIDSTILGKSPLRKVPSLVCKSKKNVVASFLKGLYDAEGCVKHHSVVFSTSSEALATSVQMLLLRFGIISHLYDHDQSKSTFGGGDAYQLCISGSESLELFSGVIGFSDRSKMPKLDEILKRAKGKEIERMDLIPIGEKAILDIAYELGLRKIDLRNLGIHYYHYLKHSPSRKKVLEIYESLLKIAKERDVESERLKSLHKLSSAPILWDPIVKTEIIETDSKEVYDLTVPGHSNYIANGVFVHNCGYIPHLYEAGYTGPLYSTAPTRDLMVLLCLDYIDVCQKEGKQVNYSKKAVEKAVKHSVVLDYGEVSDIARNVRLTLQPAGHLLGSSLVHLHVGDGLHNVLYTGDLKFGPSRLFDPAFTDFQRVETLIIESTYSGQGDFFPSMKDADANLLRVIDETMKKGGKILIPSFAVGRAQEVMAILGSTKFDYPVWIEGMLWDATAIHTAYPEYLSQRLQRDIFHHGKNPFLSDIFRYVAPRERDSVIDSGEPGVIIATSGMLVGGPAMEYLKGLAPDKKNTLMFVGYQAEGTLGRRLQKGWKEIPVRSPTGKTSVINMEMEVQTIEGLSGHSDRNQLMSYMHKLGSRPERIIVNHGEQHKTMDMARDLHKIFRCETLAPKNLEAVRLR
jgi:predicted metal-dependent RNase